MEPPRWRECTASEVGHSMDIEILRTFLEVSRTHHFGQAAKNLFISQSAVSARIRQLEERIGAPLFTRDRNDIQVTAVGQRLLRHAEAIVNSWNRARHEVTLSDALQDMLVIGGVPSLWDIILQPWLQWMYRTFPSLALTADAWTQDLLFRKLTDSTIDLSMTFESIQAGNMISREISRIPLVLVSSTPGLGAEQALGANYISVDWGPSFAVTHAQYFPDIPPPRLRTGLGRIARTFLLGHGGAAYLALPMVQRDLELKTLFRIEDAPAIDRSAYASYVAGSGKLDLIDRTLAYFDKPVP
jgi:DNA-binding transcriptional LysR family regulator